MAMRPMSSPVVQRKTSSALFADAYIRLAVHISHRDQAINLLRSHTC